MYKFDVAGPYREFYLMRLFQNKLTSLIKANIEQHSWELKNWAKFIQKAINGRANEANFNFFDMFWNLDQGVFCDRQSVKITKSSHESDKMKNAKANKLKAKSQLSAPW